MNTNEEGTNETEAQPQVDQIDVADLEEYARQGKRPPPAKLYRIRVNRDHFEFDEPNPTRETILTKAGLLPPEIWTLRLKVRGGEFIRIAPGDRVDLTAPGVEKFKALPNDQTEG
jgi:hypothetical protein